MSIPYLIYSFVVGISVVLAIIYAGLSQLSFIYSILIGGVAQSLFRLVKRMWLNKLNTSDKSDASDKTVSVSNVKVFFMVYAAMVVVSAFWYGFGALINWLF
jgi:hypothetical protein